mmetsp:Transcript_12000/g.33823  ORF Transcript_12000/g.33823 Transcript_12000/m.33823 type:complete len:456 (-) Transcript_12000:35-1402(-)
MSVATVRHDLLVVQVQVEGMPVDRLQRPFLNRIVVHVSQRAGFIVRYPVDVITGYIDAKRSVHVRCSQIPQVVRAVAGPRLGNRFERDMVVWSRGRRHVEHSKRRSSRPTIAVPGIAPPRTRRSRDVPRGSPMATPAMREHDVVVPGRALHENVQARRTRHEMTTLRSFGNLEAVHPVVRNCVRGTRGRERNGLRFGIGVDGDEPDAVPGVRVDRVRVGTGGAVIGIHPVAITKDCHNGNVPGLISKKVVDFEAVTPRVVCRSYGNDVIHTRTVLDFDKTKATTFHLLLSVLVRVGVVPHCPSHMVRGNRVLVENALIMMHLSGDVIAVCRPGDVEPVGVQICKFTRHVIAKHHTVSPAGFEHPHGARRRALCFHPSHTPPVAITRLSAIPAAISALNTSRTKRHFCAPAVEPRHVMRCKPIFTKESVAVHVESESLVVHPMHRNGVDGQKQHCP